MKYRNVLVLTGITASLVAVPVISILASKPKISTLDYTHNTFLANKGADDIIYTEGDMGSVLESGSYDVSSPDITMVDMNRSKLFDVMNAKGIISSIQRELYNKYDSSPDRSEIIGFAFSENDILQGRCTVNLNVYLHNDYSGKSDVYRYQARLSGFGSPTTTRRLETIDGASTFGNINVNDVRDEQILNFLFDKRKELISQCPIDLKKTNIEIKKVSKKGNGRELYVDYTISKYYKDHKVILNNPLPLSVHITNFKAQAATVVPKLVISDFGTDKFYDSSMNGTILGKVQTIIDAKLREYRVPPETVVQNLEMTDDSKKPQGIIEFTANLNQFYNSSGVLDPNNLKIYIQITSFKKYETLIDISDNTPFNFSEFNPSIDYLNVTDTKLKEFGLSLVKKGKIFSGQLVDNKNFTNLTEGEVTVTVGKRDDANRTINLNISLNKGVGYTKGLVSQKNLAINIKATGFVVLETKLKKTEYTFGDIFTSKVCYPSDSNIVNEKAIKQAIVTNQQKMLTGLKVASISINDFTSCNFDIDGRLGKITVHPVLKDSVANVKAPLRFTVSGFKVQKPTKVTPINLSNFGKGRAYDQSMNAEILTNVQTILDNHPEYNIPTDQRATNLSLYSNENIAKGTLVFRAQLNKKFNDDYELVSIPYLIDITVSGFEIYNTTIIARDQSRFSYPEPDANINTVSNNDIINVATKLVQDGSIFGGHIHGRDN